MSSMRLLSVAGAVLLGAACHRQQMASSASADEHSAHAASSGTAAGGGTIGLPASNGAAAARLAASPRRGEWVKIPFAPGSSDTIVAWMVKPAGSGKSPVVIVVHDIGGLGAWARAVADQAAAEGFTALSPDFTSRFRGAPSTVELPRDSVGKLMPMVTSTERNRVINAVATYAMAQPTSERRYGVIGYCWGGTTVFMHAVNRGTAGFSGGVGFYGLPYMNGATPNTDSLAKILAPVMLLNGSKDARIGAAMPGLDSVMKSLGKRYEGKNYEGATHGFMKAQDDPKPTRDLPEEAANLAATKDAWPKTIAFLKRHLM
jgi:carboxymethylenebutenolidase